MDGHWNQLQACIEDKETQLANHRPNHYSLLLLHWNVMVVVPYQVGVVVDMICWVNPFSLVSVLVDRKLC